MNVQFALGSGENQITSQMQFNYWIKGYTKGQPDVTLPMKSGRKVGLALELKSPGWHGEASEHQKACLRKLEENDWQVLVPNCYGDILFEIRDYKDKASKKRNTKENRDTWTNKHQKHSQ